MQKAYRFRLYPTDEQKQQMIRIIGCCRFTYNRLLEYCSKSYKRRGESHTSFDLNNFICHTLKKAYPWLSDAPAQTLQCVSADLSAAFKAFFRKDASYPKYKSKRRSKKSFRIPQRGKVDTEGNRIYVQGVGWVNAVIHRTPIGKLKNITVTVNPSGTAYASCLFDDATDAPVPSVPDNPKVVGVDLNLDRLAVCSDGSDYENPRTLKQHEKRLKHLQRMLSKKKKGSNNWMKLKREVSSLYEKIADIRKDAIHKMTKRIVCDREWECPVCHTRHDRDRNAALNLESFGLKALARDAGEVKPPEKPSVDEHGICSHLRNKVSGNEERTPGSPGSL